MPHLLLEYSGNVTPEIDFDRLFLGLHQVLASAAGVDVAACKSRAVRRETFVVGEGGAGQAFVHLEVRLLAGRTPEQKRDIATVCLDMLALHLAESLAALNLQITVEVRDMERLAYAKRTSPPPTATASVVIDTNCFVAAAFNPGSSSARIVDAVRAGRLRMVWNDATRREIEYVVRKIPPISFEPFVSLFRPEDRYEGETYPERQDHVPDRDDRKFLALAVAAGATLITADDHLLAGRDRAGVPVMPPGEFMRRQAPR